MTNTHDPVYAGPQEIYEAHERFWSRNDLDEQGRPFGGEVAGTGLHIEWQKGPLREQGSDEPAAPNGAFVEDVIRAAIDRIDCYQHTQFRCRENAIALTKLEEALLWLNSRTARRTAQGVEGTHQGS